MRSVHRFCFLWLFSLMVMLVCVGCQSTDTGSSSNLGLIENSPAPTSPPGINNSAFPEPTSTTGYPVPVTSNLNTPSSSLGEPTPTPLGMPVFDQFVASVVNGDPTRVVGVYVEGVMALKVVMQPGSNPSYISTQRNTATYYTIVHKITGNTGLLAHNYLAGVYYFELIPGQSIFLIYGDGSNDEYTVQSRQEFQALNPNNPASNFIDLTTGETLTSTELFYRVYGGSDRTTFQTCIAQGSEDSWGRLFVISPSEQ